MSDSANLVTTYIFLAAGCIIVGVVITFFLLLACQYFNIDIFANLWILAIPVVSAATLNVLFLELYRKRRKK